MSRTVGAAQRQAGPAVTAQTFFSLVLTLRNFVDTLGPPPVRCPCVNYVTRPYGVECIGLAASGGFSQRQLVYRMVRRINA